MKMLFLKLLRDIKQTLGQFISILLVLAVGCFFFVGMLESSNSIGSQIADFYRTQNFADATGTFAFANQTTVDKVLSRTHITAAEGRYSSTGNVHLTLNNRHDMTVATLTDTISQPMVTSGRLPKSIDECMVDASYAKQNSITVGQTLRYFTPKISAIRVPTKDGTLKTAESDKMKLEYTKATDSAIKDLPLVTVTGIFYSPEYIYKINTGNTMAKAEDFAAMLVPHGAIAMAKDIVPIYKDNDAQPFYRLNTTNMHLYNQIIVDTSATVRLQDVFSDLGGSSITFPEIPGMSIEDILASTPNIVENALMGTAFNHYIPEASYLQADHPGESAFRQTFNQITNLIYIIPFIFFIVAAIITLISLSKTVENQRTQIGIMQAIGIKKSNIYWTYLLYAFFAALFGSLIGGIGGLFALPNIYNWVFNIQFLMPPTVISLSPVFVFVGTSIAVLISLAAAFISCHHTLSEIPAQALRMKPPKRTRIILLERWKWFWAKIGFGAKMIFRNLYLNKMRILLSSIGVIGCTALLIAGIGLRDRVTFIVDHYAQSVNYDMQIFSVTDFDRNDKNAIIQLDDNIQDIIYTPTSVGTASFGNITTDKMQIMALPQMSGVNAMKLYADENSKQLVEFNRPKMLVLPQTVAKDIGAAIGDKVILTTTTYGSTVLEVSAIVYQHVMANIYVTYDVFDQLGVPATATSAHVFLKDPSITNTTRNNILQDGNSTTIRSCNTKQDIMDSVTRTLVILDVVVAIIIIGAAVLSITVIYNITSINIFERTREIATLMVLGYKKIETNRLIIVENMVITGIGCLLGLPCGFGLFLWLVGIVNSMQIALPANLMFYVVLIAFALAFVFSLIATFFLSRKMQKISMVESLKSVD